VDGTRADGARGGARGRTRQLWSRALRSLSLLRRQPDHHCDLAADPFVDADGSMMLQQ